MRKIIRSFLAAKICFCLFVVCQANEIDGIILEQRKQLQKLSSKDISYKSVRGGNSRFKTLTLDKLPIDIPPAPKLNKYGGDSSVQHDASGYFRVQKITGAWTLIDPLGNPFYSVGLCSVNLKDKDLLNQNVFDSKQAWVEHTDQLMKEFGFNTYANWTDHYAFKNHRKPFTANLSMIARFANERNYGERGYGNFKFKNDVMPVFDPEFEVYSKQYAKSLQKYQNNPYLIGVFSDNELPFFKIEGGLKAYLDLDKADAGHQAARKWLENKGLKKGDIKQSHDREFSKLVMHRYFSVVRAAIKEVLPNHLYLGTRFHGRALNEEALWEISGKYVDVISVNYYHRWTPEKDRILKWESLSGRPIMVTEFYAKAKDTGLDNSSGAGFDVDTQQDRGDFYQNYCIGLLRNPAVVGWHWFRYIDDHKKGVECNKGVLDKDFRPYQDLKESMTPINKNVYQLRKILVGLESKAFRDE